MERKHTNKIRTPKSCPPAYGPSEKLKIKKHRLQVDLVRIILDLSLKRRKRRKRDIWRRKIFLPLRRTKTKKEKEKNIRRRKIFCPRMRRR